MLGLDLAGRKRHDPRLFGLAVQPVGGQFRIVGNWTGYAYTGISWPVASNLDWPTTLA